MSRRPFPRFAVREGVRGGRVARARRVAVAPMPPPPGIVAAPVPVAAPPPVPVAAPIVRQPIGLPGIVEEMRIRGELTAMRRRLATRREEVGRLRAELNALEGRLAGLRTQRAEVQGKLTEASRRLDEQRIKNTSLSATYREYTALYAKMREKGLLMEV